MAADLHPLELLLPSALLLPSSLDRFIVCVCCCIAFRGSWHMRKYFLFRRKIAGTVRKVPKF